jgi:AcrR family transcriptional regulator
VSTRNYRSPRREADAAATRARIVDTAGRLFIRDGYAATSMKAIAAEAGVSVPTVHLHGPKHALLIAAFERTFAGDEGRHPLAERPAMVEIINEPDDLLAMTRYAAFLAGANERAAGIIRALTLAADADEGARAACLDLEERRRRDMLLGAGFFVQRGLISPDRRQWAADLLGTVTGPDAYLHLVETCGWPRADYEAWLLDSLQHLVQSGRT